MTQYGRHICGQALIVSGGWFSLHYGWGIDVQSWPVLVVFGALLCTMLAPINGWIAKGKKGGAE